MHNWWRSQCIDGTKTYVRISHQCNSEKLERKEKEVNGDLSTYENEAESKQLSVNTTQ